MNAGTEFLLPVVLKLTEISITWDLNRPMMRVSGHIVMGDGTKGLEIGVLEPLHPGHLDEIIKEIEQKFGGKVMRHVQGLTMVDMR